MSTLIIRKKSLKTWLHTDSVLGDFIISKFYFNADNGNFQVVEQGQSKRVIYDVTDIALYDDTDGGVAETFANITALSLRLEELNYPAFQYDGQIVSIANLIEAGTNVTITGDGTEASPYVISSSGGGGGAVTSVNSDIGDVIVDLQSVTDENNELTTDINVKSTVFKIGGLDEDNPGAVVVIDNDEGSIKFQRQLIEIWNFNKGIFAGTNNVGKYFSFAFDNLTNNIFINQNNRESGTYSFAIDEIEQTANFTADNNTTYTANGTLTVTDPTSVTNKGYIVHVIGGTSTIGGVGYTSGDLVYRYYDGSGWISTNMNSAITIDATPTDGSSNAVSSNGVFDGLALKQDKVTGVSDTEIGYLDGVTSAIQTQLNNRVRYLVKDTVVSSAVTGTGAETLAKSYTIPANTLGANDYFRINCITTIKTGTADISVIRVRISNTNTFAGSSLISTTTHSATAVNMKHMRDLAYRGGVLKGVGNTTTIFQDKDRVAVAYTSTTIDFTQAVYVFVSIQNANLGDSTVIEDVLISN